MKKSKNLTINCARIVLKAFVLLAIAATAWAQSASDFSGQWKQDNDRCLPKRNGDVTLRIEHHDPELTIETTMSHGSQNPRHALQKYTTDGRISVSTGADGDEFHTSAVRKDSSLVFSIEEHEDGRILQSKEIWTLIENGATLERIRERPAGESQTLFYRRVLASDPTSKSGIAEVRDK
ncbi:MAG: hypothetical protein ABR905_04375 [Terracidiphilus sp.]